MEILAAIEGSAIAEWLRFSRWAYAGLSAVHILGIALLVGSAVPMDLRLLGAWRSLELGETYRVLARFAATGLVVAVASGALLFATRATEYAALDLFLLKMMLVLLGTSHAAALHWMGAFPRASPGLRRAAGALSLAIWPLVLVCGRMLAFV